jgi:hypothetical protein
MTPSQAAECVRRGQAPRGIDRIDRPNPPFEDWHAHLGPGEGSPAIYIDGTWKHGPGRLTRRQADFLREAGWNV